MSQQSLNILHTESSTGWGGQELRILGEAHGFLERGHRVTIACPTTAELYDAAKACGIPVVALPIYKKRFGALFAVRNYLKANRDVFDVINTHSSTDCWLVALAAKGLRLPTPIVRTRHVSTHVNSQWSTRWLYTKGVAHIVTTGEALRKQLHKQNGYPLKHMTSVPTGIDLGMFQPLDMSSSREQLKLPLDAPIIGIVATLRDWKGHTILFEALPKILQEQPDARVVVVGDGPYEPSLRRKIHALHLEQSVYFAGRRSDVPTWLNAFDIFVLPSWGDEGVPQAIMQAMACGKPVVSTHVGAIHEAVAHQKTGLLVAPRDSNALANALLQLLKDRELRQQYAAASLKRARKHFGATHMIEGMETVFRTVIQNKRVKL